MTTDVQPDEASAEQPPPGVRLGLPAQGRGSVAGVGRRFVGLLIDGAASYLIAEAFVRRSTPGGWSSVAFLVETVVLLSLTGQTLGMAAVRLRAVPLSGGRILPYWALVRQVLLLMFIPAVVLDVDRRGLHDKAAGVVVVNA